MEEATSSQEGDVVQESPPVAEPPSRVETTSRVQSSLRVKTEIPSQSKYWDEELPEKHLRKPNPRYAHNTNVSVRLQDICLSALLSLNGKDNTLREESTHYSRMLALLQLVTDPYSNEIDGDMNP
jgi:hypothetical protein